ncbi:hypothetical protein MJ561_16835 [Klebsiella pneumoniae]|nr:hypothetical protein MJ561_16835 [Klebsiella pneumoniae]
MTTRPVRELLGRPAGTSTDAKQGRSRPELVRHGLVAASWRPRGGADERRYQAGACYQHGVFPVPARSSCLPRPAARFTVVQVSENAARRHGTDW